MISTNCMAIYLAAKAERSRYPLHSGAYKLRETLRNLERVLDYLNSARNLRWKHRPTTLAVFSCREEANAYVKNTPQETLRMLAYDVLPALEVLERDGLSVADSEAVRAQYAPKFERLLDWSSHLQNRLTLVHEYRNDGESPLRQLVSELMMMLERVISEIEELAAKSRRKTTF